MTGEDQTRETLMRQMRKYLGATVAAMMILAPAAAAQGAEGDQVCAAIARIAAAAQERLPFRSVAAALARGEAVVPGFEARECSFSRTGIECEGTRYSSVFNDWPELTQCSGVSVFEPPPQRRRVRYPSNRAYRLGPLLVARGVRCPGCRALGPPFFIMEVYRARDPE